ncbi:MAG: DUF2807 domain-containing protein [Flavobacteriales bacterium]|nr:DUF2807 domain-containing protein [Flavobacteriales bacterium]MCB9168392.1 DUF2807 domain-containing protein [Flavobacteriales bacterium]
MRCLKTFPLIALALPLLTACHKEHLHGSGQIITQERDLPPFTNVLIQGPVKANIHYGATQEVTVRTDVVAINALWTTVSNNTLLLDVDGGNTYQHITFEVDIQLPALDRLTHEGASNATVSGFENTDALEVVHHGAGNITLDGSTADLHITHDGVGKVRAFDMIADTCHVDHSGVGNIEVTVLDRLEAHLSGVGNLYYQGSPQVDAIVTGVGHLIHVD